MTEQELRQKVVSTMQGWLGYNEVNRKHRKIIDIYNSHKPLARNYAVQYDDEWCATTVSAAFIKNGLTDIGFTECSCTKMIDLYKAKGRWMERDDYTPEPGDILMYYWKDGKDYAYTDCTSAPNHVGIVEKVSGKSITIIEGNKGESVSRRSLVVNGQFIRGYCLPDYAAKATQEDDMSEDQFYDMFLQAMAKYCKEQNKQPAGSTHSKAWSKAKKAGVMDGSQPKAPLTREQAATVMDRLGLLGK